MAEAQTARPALTEAQRRAREAFDLDAAMDALPAHSPTAAGSFKGAAGVRLRPHLVADISDDLLREFARETLKAARMSEPYLDALRVVLGNQAEAARLGYTLEMNVRVPFAPVGIMRTIIGQMKRAGITHGSLVLLGSGRTQVVQCFAAEQHRHADAAEELVSMYRKTEEATPDAPPMSLWNPTGGRDLGIRPDDAPH